MASGSHNGEGPRSTAPSASCRLRGNAPCAPRLFTPPSACAPAVPVVAALRSRPRALCHRSQKHFRMCRRIHPSSRNIGCRSSASRKYPHQPRTYRVPFVSQLVTGQTLAASPHLPHLRFESLHALRRDSDPPFPIQSKAQELAFPDPPCPALGGIHLQSQMLLDPVPVSTPASAPPPPDCLRKYCSRPRIGRSLPSPLQFLDRVHPDRCWPAAETAGRLAASLPRWLSPPRPPSRPAADTSRSIATPVCPGSLVAIRPIRMS